MCREGVRAFVNKLRDEGVSDLEQRDWCMVADGFGDGEGPAELLMENCPVCNERFPVVKRVLQSDAYNFPDVAAYQRLRLGAPCLALGYVTSKTTHKWVPDNYPSLRERWQGLLWHVYDVAFVDVQEGAVGEFCPVGNWWGDKAVVGELRDIMAGVQEPLEQARRDTRIPVGHDSRATEQALMPILSPVFRGYGYELDSKGMGKVYSAFWCGFQLDLLYRRQRDQNSIAIEVKVTEDCDHPINQSLKNLLHHNAVLNVRVPLRGDALDQKTRRLATEAEGKLEDTGRAGFICIWPKGAERKS